MTHALISSTSFCFLDKLFSQCWEVLPRLFTKNYYFSPEVKPRVWAPVFTPPYTPYSNFTASSFAVVHQDATSATETFPTSPASCRYHHKTFHSPPEQMSFNSHHLCVCSIKFAEEKERSRPRSGRHQKHVSPTAIQKAQRQR